MDRSKGEDLQNVISSQKAQIIRYETRLKDIVTAYKGLLKEKEALESSLSAVSKPTSSFASKESVIDANGTLPAEKENVASMEAQKISEVQIATLMNSLATLSAEKSRMEASFQADKKQLRQDIANKERLIAELRQNYKECQVNYQLEIESSRSKLIVERHDREQERNDNLVIIKELQKLITDERQTRKNLENQLNQQSVEKFTPQPDANDNKVREVYKELELAKKKLKQYENMRTELSDNEQQSLSILQQLQSEMITMKQNHSIALKEEQRRAQVAEEANKCLASIHEERVNNLESRLTELSATVGKYDRLRQQDQENIMKLKEKIFHLVNNDQQLVRTTTTNDENEMFNTRTNSGQTLETVEDIIEEISHLKQLLFITNNKLDVPRDLTKILGSANNIDHSSCTDNLTKYRKQSDTLLRENENLLKDIEQQKFHIKTLQVKVKDLNKHIDENESEMKSKIADMNAEIKCEKEKSRETVSSIENDYKHKLSQMEHQLQKQRERSLVLLEEKENEIKTLKMSFELFIPQEIGHNYQEPSPSDNDQSNVEDPTTKNRSLSVILGQAAGNPMVMNSTNQSNGDSSIRVLHYAHQLARKDVDISSLRKAKHLAETMLRQALQDKIASAEHLHSKISMLKEQVDRLERNKSREGENLEYLKNVVLSFIVESNIENKKHMLNAIGAVLKFSPSEIKELSKGFFKKGH